MYEDDRLAEALREGSEQAYEVLVTRFQQPVYNLVFRLMSDPVDSSDVVQEVFLKIFRNIGSFRNQSSLKTWIYRIAVNEAYNYRRWFFRHRRQEVTLGLEGDPARYAAETHDTGRSPFDQVFEHEKHRLIEEALTRINPTFRTAVVLRDIEGLSYEEIADILNLSMGTVKSRILRGRDALREQLAARLQPREAFQWSAQTAAD
ncbi:MAG: sigma-70 family RNA polymerase sigma factor [Acidobacteria bacterium]|nr:sigma-70 family RNA polymerase sigma factor [Acidobacteriota bacterium]MBI3470007.1 sigma-70 family RNA polymerase sigma factor [Candidatus Solibacter usitatus]